MLSVDKSIMSLMKKVSLASLILSIEGGSKIELLPARNLRVRPISDIRHPFGQKLPIPKVFVEENLSVKMQFLRVTAMTPHGLWLSLLKVPADRQVHVWRPAICNLIPILNRDNSTAARQLMMQNCQRVISESDSVGAFKKIINSRDIPIRGRNG